MIGRYEVLRRLGTGGMAVVHLARQTDLERLVALKELQALHADDPSYAQRFLREARLAGSITDPNVVTVHEYLEHDGTPYIAMEYLERGSLRPYVGKLGLAQISGVLEAVLHGLMSAEREGVVHRDLKPENVLVTADGRVKIADFGIAKATSQLNVGTFQTSTGMLIGTPTYMAPEQAMGQNIGPWTDLYSVGCMAFELFTGERPFADVDAPMAILMRHATEPIPRVEGIDPRIADWIERLLEKEPEERTQTAQQAWDEYEELALELLGPRWRREARLAHGPDEAPPPPPVPTEPPAAPAPRMPTAALAVETPPAEPRRRLPLILGGGALIAIIVVALLLLLPGEKEETANPSATTAEIPATNLTANASFITDTAGWAPFQGALARETVPDAPDGDSVARVSSSIDGDQYAIDDEPDTLEAATKQGQTYVATAWVKATETTDGKPVCLAIREDDPHASNDDFVGTAEARIIARTDAYQQLKTSYTAQNDGNTITLHVYRWSDDVRQGESFLVDAITLTPSADPADGRRVDEARCLG